MFPILQIGGLAVQVPGLLLLAGLWAGLAAAERRAHLHRIPAETVYNLVFAGLVWGLIGARLAYAGLHLEAFLRSPLGLLSLRPELLDPLGGLAAGALGLALAVRKRSLAWGRVLDALTPLFAALLIAVPAANLAAGTGYGAPTDLPWAIELWGARRHPSQVYELLAAAAIFAYFYRRIPAGERAPGSVFLNFLVVSALARIFLEAFRGAGPVIGPGWRGVQVAAWLVAAGGLAGLWWRIRKTG